MRLLGPIANRKDWVSMRQFSKNDPGRFHAEIVRSEIYWFNEKLNQWLKYQRQNPTSDECKWHAFNANSGAEEISDLDFTFFPFHTFLDSSEKPFYRWFVGGKTNASFNEVDVHVLNHFGDEIAFYFQGDRWDPAIDSGKGGPVLEKCISRKQLLLETIICARILKNLGLKKGDKIALNMPNVLEQIYFIEAAKRLGIIYTCVFGGFSAKTLADRIFDSGASIVITTDGAYRNAQVVPFKQAYTDLALDNFISIEDAKTSVNGTLKKLGVAETILSSIEYAIAQFLESEITVERADVMIGVGKALEQISELSIEEKTTIRTRLIENLIKVTSRVKKTIVCRHVQIADLRWSNERDLWFHELTKDALLEIVDQAKNIQLKPNSSHEEICEKLLLLDDHQLYQLGQEVAKTEIVDADFPLFIIYTSGSTGKPKGVVHTHGGYIAGIANTMRHSFNVDPEAKKQSDVIFVVADPGWITGQSYMISAALTTRTPSVILEGSPIFPNAGRFTSAIERYKVTIFKAGSTFLKAITADAQNIIDMKKYNVSSLKVGTFCAEPTSPAIQEFAMKNLCANYINSYWATEHGGIILTHFYGNRDFKLKADAHTFPLPWIFAEVWRGGKSIEVNGKAAHEHSLAEIEEKAEIVITAPYPYMARTIWGDKDHAAEQNWRGDIKRFQDTYFKQWLVPGKNAQEFECVYTQGDFATTYADGGMSLHGRSDDVINTSGHRIGTEEIEGAILREKQLNPQTNLGNVIVIGAPHPEKGTVPVAFIQTSMGKALTGDEEARLSNLVRENKGAVAIPAGYIYVSQFPETRSGKYMRRFLRCMLEGEPLGDITTLKNPESLIEIEKAISTWQTKTRLEQAQVFLSTYSSVKVEYYPITKNAKMAMVIVNKPPVNALDERTLDELLLIFSHIERNDEVKASILTGSGTKSFIAGADIRQFLEEMHTKEDVLPFSRKAAQVTSQIESMKKPVISAVNGVALGGGCEMLLATHYRICVSDARFGQPEINLNLLPGYGGTQRLPRLLQSFNGEEGLITACEMILGGREVDAKQALKIGLIHEICENQDVLSRATELIKEYLKSKNSILGQELKKRHEQNLQWRRTARFSTEVFENPRVLRITNQLKHSGRSLSLQWILDAIKFGFEEGLNKGLAFEGELFSEAIIHPEAGKKGIRAFFDKNSRPLPSRHDEELDAARKNEAALLNSGELLSVKSPFFPGVTKTPSFQYCYCVEKSSTTGEAALGDPQKFENKRIVPVAKPSSNEALLYILVSEINFNDIWAVTGVPVSPFDSNDEDWHITGSGGLALVVEMGEELKREGRIKFGDLVAVFSGQSEVLSPSMGLDPMFANQKIQGYESGDGSHQQFMIAQGPQLHGKVPGLTLEESGSYILNLGTIYRAIFTTLKIEPNKTMFVEGAATGTGAEAVKVASSNSIQVVGLVSSEERKKTVRSFGGVGAINRKDSDLANIFTAIPEDQSQWREWEKKGEPLLKKFRAETKGRLADYVISHSGEQTFPRSFQLLEENGILTFFGASTGYHFTFMGKKGESTPLNMLNRVQLRAGDSVLIYYGLPDGATFDLKGIAAIEACREKRARPVICTGNDSQKEYVRSLGYGDAIQGVFSIEEIMRKEGNKFVFPKTMPQLPNPKEHLAEFKERVRWYQEMVFKPFASHLGKFTRGSRGMPDFIIERPFQDTLALSSMVVKAFTGRILYFENMQDRRFSFYAPQIWMRQRRIDMPTAHIWGTHLSNSYEVESLNRLISLGLLNVTAPMVIEFDQLPNAHQEMWENRHRASNYVLNHCLPTTGLKSRDELFQAWMSEL